MTPWVFRLIAANVVVYILQITGGPAVTNLLGLIPAAILFRPWTIVTYMFVHDPHGISHILFNMLGLFFFGPQLEAHLGSKRFLWLYFAGGITGGLACFITPQVFTIGASAAVFGVFFGFAYFWPRAQIYIWGIFPVEARWLVVGMTALSLYGGLGSSGDGIAHFAHLGGYLGGYLYLKWDERRAAASALINRVSAPVLLAADLERWKRIDRARLHEVNRAEYDRIMEKINTHGVGSLYDGEKAFLDRFSS